MRPHWTMYARGVVAAAIFGIGAAYLFGREYGVMVAVCFLIGWKIQADQMAGPKR